MKLTLNEKKVLKLLLANSRISDKEIASQLKISNVAVGKIRKKLESSLIESYSINLKLDKVGIKAFALVKTKLLKSDKKLELSDVENKLLNIPHVIAVSRVPQGNSSYLALYAFRNLEDIHNFFHFAFPKLGLDEFFENQDVSIFSNNSLLKFDYNDLFNKLIDDSKVKSSKLIFK